MLKNTRQLTEFVETLADDARALLAATSDATEDRVREARKRLSLALDGSKEVYDNVRDQAVRGAKYADAAVRENPYAPIAAALIIGGLLAFLFTRRRD